MFVLEWLPAYRAEVFESLRDRLYQGGVELVLAYGNPSREFEHRRDSAQADGAICRPNRFVPFGNKQLVWQPWRDEAKRADLVVVNEGARLALNYWLLGRQSVGMRPAVALWGHGANLDHTSASRPVEKAKRYLYRLPHWWFPYTEGSKHRVVSLGFPADRTTVVQNTVATEALQGHLESVDADDVNAFREELKLGGGPIGLFLGSLYEAKRIPFLLSAADFIHAERPDFSLVIAGDGPDRDLVHSEVDKRPHVRSMGRADGRLKATLLKAASLLLVPGAVGLSVVDGFVGGIPSVSTGVQTHGPEFEYLEPGTNSEILPASATPREYAKAVLMLLNDPTRMEALQQGALEAAMRYSGTEMVGRFAAGIEKALQARQT